MKHESKIQKDSFSGKPVTRSSEPEPSSKEVLMLGSGLLLLTLGIGGMLMFSEDEPLHAKASKSVDMQQISKAFQSTRTTDLPAMEKADTSSLASFVSLEENTSLTASPDEADVYFEFDRATLSEDAKITIQEKVDHFKENQEGNIIVQGYADQRGSDSYNQALGLRRAKAVKTYLMSQGIQESSIETKSSGSQESICTEDSEECFQQNRRVHIVVSANELSASVETPLVTKLAETEQENIVTTESDLLASPLSEEDSPTTTVLLSETAEEMGSSDVTTVTESLP